jgi:3-deoxy-D-manno-octulosonic-acid transferase
VLRRVDLVLAQNDEYARRYSALGARRVEVAGNLKFDSLPKVDEAAERDRYRRLIGEPLLVAGSTSAPEEEIILDAYRELLKQFPKLRLAIAPRHLERLPEVLRVVEAKGFVPRRLSQGPAPDGVAILDTMGELYKLYCAATVTFVGGSFSGRGGQSIIEPASLGKPIVTGPDLRNFADTAEALKTLGALRVAQSPGLVTKLISERLSQPPSESTVRSFVRASLGSTTRVADVLLSITNSSRRDVL